MIPHPRLLIGSVLLMLAAGPVSTEASIRSELTPEEHLLYVQQTHGPGWRSLNLTQRCARMEQMRTQWRSMSPAARDQLKQQLAARWQAMPAAEKQRIEQRIAARRVRHAERSGPRAQSRCTGSNGSPL